MQNRATRCREMLRRAKLNYQSPAGGYNAG